MPAAGATAPGAARADSGTLFSASPEVNPAALYLANLRPSGRRSSLSRLRKIARLLSAEFALAAWHELRYVHVAYLRARLQSDGLAPSTVNLMLCIIRRVAQTACALRQLPASEYQRIREVERVRGARLPAGRALSRDELSALFRACAADCSPAGRRDACLIGLLVGAGLRRDEACALDVGDFSTTPPSLRVRGKGNKERLVFIDAGTARAISTWTKARGRSAGPLLCRVAKGGHVLVKRLSGNAVYDALRRRAREAGLRASCSPHDLRRTHVSELLDRGVDIRTVQVRVGHNDPATTARYDRRGERAQKKAIALLSLPYKPPRKKRPARRRSKRRRHSRK